MHVQNMNPECMQPLSYAQQLAYNAVKWEHSHSSHYTKWKYDVPQGYAPCPTQKPFCSDGDYGVQRIRSWGSTCPGANGSFPSCAKNVPSNPEVGKIPGEQLLYFQTNFDSKCNDLSKLSHDLSNMMEQLAALTKNKNTALKIVNELQLNYKNLLKKSNLQEKEIGALKCENKKLLQQVKKQNSEGVEFGDLKRGLQTCENKLQMLEKTMKEMLKKYQNITENNGTGNQNENQELLKVNAALTTRLKQALEDLEKYRSGVTSICKLYNDIDEEKDPKYQKVVLQQRSLESRLQIFEENDMKRLQDIMSQNDVQIESELKRISSYIEQTPSADVSIEKSLTEIVETSVETKNKGSHMETSKTKSSHLRFNVISQDTNGKKRDQPVAMGSKTSPIRAPLSSRDHNMSTKEMDDSAEPQKSISQLMNIINEEIDKTVDTSKRIEESQEVCDSDCTLSTNQTENECSICPNEKENQVNSDSYCTFPTDHKGCCSSQDEEAQMDPELMVAELKLLETKYCTTIDEDYELECVCEPCDC